MTKLLDEIKKAADPSEEVPDLLDCLSLLGSAAERIEVLEKALTVDQLGEAIKTGFIAMGDSNHSTNALKSIKRMSPREWREVLQYALYQLKAQNKIHDYSWVGFDLAKPGSETTVYFERDGTPISGLPDDFKPAMRVTVFERPDAKQTDHMVIVDEKTAIAAQDIQDAIPNARFTYKAYGTAATICLKGDIPRGLEDGQWVVGKGVETRAVVVDTVVPKPVAEIDWKAFVDKCVNNLIVNAALRPMLTRVANRNWWNNFIREEQDDETIAVLRKAVRGKEG